MNVDLVELKKKVDAQRALWSKTENWAKLGVPASYSMDYALAIYAYTLETPSICDALNRSMFANKSVGSVSARWAPTTAYSKELQACIPFAKYLDAALKALPDSFKYTGTVHRGVKWVYPSPDDHNPAVHFAEGEETLWYEYKSTSRSEEVMDKPHFAGKRAGPRTIFYIHATDAYSIEKFSFLQGKASEYEVLFRPLARFQVTGSEKRILNPKEKRFTKKSGRPDAVYFTQVERTARETY